MKQKKLVTTITGLFGLSALCLNVAQAGGGSVIVDSFSDVPEAGLTTLREALEEINSLPSLTLVIEFDETVFSQPRTIELESGELILSTSTIIAGPGAELLTIDAQGLSRVLTIDDPTSTTNETSISGITFTGGNGVSDNAVDLENNRGGCIFTKEPLTIRESIVTACESSIDGGGVGSLNAELSIIDSEISDNSTAFKGGGIKSQGGQLTIINSTISGNTANRSSFAGAAIETSRAPLVITNSTISNNQSSAGAIGGISVYQNSDLTLHNTTVVNNSGGGISTRRASLVNMSNSIIADNSDGDCNFIEIDENSMNQFNIDTDGSCDVFSTNHITIADPMLEPLANYGGLTKTHRPEEGSPVIDAGDDALCADFDQRGEIRPQDGDGNDTSICDIGAVELTGFEDIIFINGFEQ